MARQIVDLQDEKTGLEKGLKDLTKKLEKKEEDLKGLKEII